MKKKHYGYQIILTILIICSLGTFMYLARGRYVYEGDRALYLDDLGAWETFDPSNDLSFWEKLTDTGAQKVRYINNFFLIVVWKYIGIYYERIDTVLMINNIVLVSILFLTLRRILRAVLEASEQETGDPVTISNLIAAAGALIFAASRFANYSYEELFGIMEGLGSIFTFIFIMLLFLDAFRFGKHYWLSYLFWIFAVYSHERYMCLAGVLVAYLFMGCFYNREMPFSVKYILRFVSTIGLFALFICHRIILFGNRSFDGTGGTSMKETLTIDSFLEMLGKQKGYLLGINAEGDAYLNGIDPLQVRPWVNNLTYVVHIIIIAIIVLYFVCIWKNKKEMCRLFIFPIAIACLVVSSSTTIRVEMRWMYTSIGLEVMAVMYMLVTLIASAPEATTNMVLQQISSNRIKVAGISAAFLALLGVMIESYYVSYWDNIFNWGSRLEARYFSDCMDHYDSIRTLYIVNGDRSSIGEGGIRGLCKAEHHEITDIAFVKTASDIKKVDTTKDAVFLLDGRRFTDISDMFSSIDYLEGKYDDGWCENYVKFSYDSETTQSLSLTIFIPDNEFLTDGSTIEVYINSELKGTLSVSPFYAGELEVEGITEGANVIEIISDFWVIEDSGRSDNGKLSFVLTGVRFIEK